MQTELIPQEIQEIPAAIQATVAETRSTAQQAARAIQQRHPRRIFLIGNGTSFYSSLAASYTARALAGPDEAYVGAVPSGDFRYFMPQVNENDVLVGISASGEFRDVLAVFEQLHGRCLCVGITHIPGSSITRLADHTLISAGGLSQVPVMTKTYAATLVTAHLLMLETFSAPEEYFADLSASAGRAQEATEKAGPLISEVLPAFAQYQHAFYFGAGPAYAAALEGALKMKEMAMLHAEGSETWEMASGPATIVDKGFICTALYTGSETDEDTANGALHARQWGARVLEVGEKAAAGEWHLPVRAPKYPCFASLALIPPLALLAYRVARQRGFNPDHPHWRDRYISQGMSHILGE